MKSFEIFKILDLKVCSSKSKLVFQFVELLPYLFSDLNDGKAEFLQEYRLEWKHVDTKVLEPSLELDILANQRLSEC